MAVRQLNQKRFFRRITFIGDHFRGNTPPPLGMTTPSYPRLSLAFLLSPVILYFLPSSSSLSPLFGLFLFLLSRPSFSSLSFYVSPFFLFFPFLLFFVPSLSSDSRLSFRSPFIFFSVFLFSFSSVPSFSSLSLPSSFFLPSYSSLFYFFLPCFSSLSFLSLLNVVFLPFLPFLSFLSLFFLFSPSSSSSLSFLSILYPFFLLFIPFSALSLLSLLSPLFFSLSSSFIQTPLSLFSANFSISPSLTFLSPYLLFISFLSSLPLFLSASIFVSVHLPLSLFKCIYFPYIFLSLYKYMYFFSCCISVPLPTAFLLPLLSPIHPPLPLSLPTVCLPLSFSIHPSYVSILTHFRVFVTNICIYYFTLFYVSHRKIFICLSFSFLFLFSFFLKENCF